MLKRGYEFKVEINDYFGEEAFFSGFQRDHSAFTLETSSLLKISRVKFLDLLESFKFDQVQNYIIFRKFSICTNTSTNLTLGP